MSELVSLIEKLLPAELIVPIIYIAAIGFAWMRVLHFAEEKDPWKVAHEKERAMLSLEKLRYEVELLRKQLGKELPAETPELTKPVFKSQQLEQQTWTGRKHITLEFRNFLKKPRATFGSPDTIVGYCAFLGAAGSYSIVYFYITRSDVSNPGMILLGTVWSLGAGISQAIASAFSDEKPGMTASAFAGSFFVLAPIGLLYLMGWLLKFLF